MDEKCKVERIPTSSRNRSRPVSDVEKDMTDSWRAELPSRPRSTWIWSLDVEEDLKTTGASGESQSEWDSDWTARARMGVADARWAPGPI